VKSVTVEEFWRVGRRADPLNVDAKYQGAGRFDDPERLVSMLYGALTLKTCLLEFILASKTPASLPKFQNVIPEPTNDAEAVDAERDRLIAVAPRLVRPDLYKRDAVFVRAAPPLTLLDLRDVAVRDRLYGSRDVEREVSCWGFRQLDLGALLSPRRPLTQAVVHAVLNETLV